MSSKEEYLARRREIDAFAAEMVSTVPQVKNLYIPVPEPVVDSDTEDGPFVVENVSSKEVPNGDNSSDEEGFEVDENEDAADDEILDSAQELEIINGDIEDEDSENINNSASSSSSGSSSSRNYDLKIREEIEIEDKLNASAAEISLNQNLELIDNIDLFAQKRKIPVSHEVKLEGSVKAVMCISIEPAGNRLVTGSLDYAAKMFDFGGMDRNHRAFRSVDIQDGYPVTALSHSSTGDRFIASTGSSQPKIYDREGQELEKFVKGDMYIRDLNNTKGHTMEVTGVQWHPSDKNVVLTSSLDGSLRLWDLDGVRAFGALCQKHVLKIRGATGQNRVGASCCCYTPNGLRMIGGANDGSIHIWQERKVYGRPDLLIRPAHTTGALITSVIVSPNNLLLASRGDDSMVKLWTLPTNLIQKPTVPIKEFKDLLNIYHSANVAFSPDSTLICCGTSPVSTDPSSKSLLCFFETSSKIKAGGPVMQMGVEGGGVSAIFVRWQGTTNQIFCSTSTGGVKVFYDPLLSKKGALLTAGKAPKKREKDDLDQTEGGLMGEIFYPNALPLFKAERPDIKRGREKRDPYLTKMPEKQLDKGPGAGKKENMSFFFTKYVTEGKKMNTSRTEDPRAALLAMDEKAKADPMFFGRAYEKANPKDGKNLLHTQTFEEEQEEFKKKQRKFN